MKSSSKFSIFVGQNINPWLGITLIALMAFWTILYYLTNKAEAIADNAIAERAEYLDAKK